MNQPRIVTCWEGMPVHFSIPTRLVSGANAREHWRVKAKRATAQRWLGYTWTQTNCPYFVGRNHSTYSATILVTITRVGKRKMDDDNLAISAKHLRDGIADALGLDDGDDSKIRWAYSQRIGKHYAADVLIQELP